MLTKIIIYYCDPLRFQLKDFLFNYIMKPYMADNDMAITENHHSNNTWHLILRNTHNDIIDIMCKLFNKNTIKEEYANEYYLQEHVYEYGDKQLLEKLNEYRYKDKSPIYIFNDEGVIGEWNIN